MRIERKGIDWRGGTVLALLVLAGCTAPLERPLYGQWKGDIGGEAVTLELGAGHRFRMQQGQRSIEGRWRSHAPDHPDWLDLWVVREGGGRRLVPLLARRVDAGHLRIRVGDHLRFRPTRFAAQDGPDQATLQRVAR